MISLARAGLNAGTEPRRECRFRALPVANLLGNTGELIAHVGGVAGVSEAIETQKGVGGDRGGALVAFDEGLRDADREEGGEDDWIVLATERTRHAGAVDGGFQRRRITQWHRRETRALHDFRMERDDFHDAKMANLGHLVLGERAVARLVLLPRFLKDLPQFGREHRTEFERLHINEQDLSLVEVQSLDLFLPEKTHSK